MSQHRRSMPEPVRPGDTNAMVAWFQDVVRQVRLSWRLFQDKRVPIWLKLIPPAALAYIIFPIDIVPDVVPAAGQLDDIAVLLLGIKLFIELAPPQIRREHLRALGAHTREWRVVDEDEQPSTVVEGQFKLEPDGGEPGTGQEPADKDDTISPDD